MQLLERVNADFEQLLRNTDAAAQMEMLTSKMKAKGMEMQGKAFPTFLKPYFVEQSARERIAKVTEAIIRGLEKVGEAFMSGYDFHGLIHQEGRTADLSKVDPIYPGFQVMVRLDVFYTPATGELKFLEFNCGDPSGMGWHDAMLDIFLELPVIKALGEKYDLQTDHLLVTQFQAVMKKYRQFCERKGIPAKEKPNCAIICSRDSTILVDVELIVEYYQQQGCQTFFADPRDFKYDGKRVYLNGVEIDAVYRDALDDFIKDKYWNDCQDIIQAYRDGNICFINPVRAATGDFKTLPAIMSDDQYKDLFAPEDWEIMQQCVPWTRHVRPGKTTFHGEEIDLIPYLKEHKDIFVLKPNEGYGGFGIKIGKETDPQEWQTAVDQAVAPGADYAVQEFLKVPVDTFPVVADGQLKGFEPKNVNINFWSHAGQFAGAFLRASSGLLINVHQGGGLVPVFFVAEKS